MTYKWPSSFQHPTIGYPQLSFITLTPTPFKRVSCAERMHWIRELR